MGVKTAGPQVSPAAGATVKEDFGSTELAVQAETSASALAARAQAKVQAAFVMAERHPRDWDDVRVKLLRECQRPGFARAARYSKPVGSGRVEGPSIRFAEAALRLMRNVVVDQSIIRDDATRRSIEVVVLDAEANVHYTRQVSIDKTVERSYVKDGQVVLGERVNTNGKKAYLVAATEDDLANKQAAAVSKALRTEGLRLLPGDIMEECMQECVATQRKQDAKDPDQARKDVCDGFAEINVTPAMLKAYLGHEVGTISPAELTDLRALYAAIRDGETTWVAVMEERGGANAPKAPAAPVPAVQTAPTAAPTPPAPVTVDAQSATQPPSAASEPATSPPAPVTEPAKVESPQSAEKSTPPAETLTPEEQAIADGLASATKKSEVTALIKKLRTLPEERQKVWRERFNARMSQLP